MPHVHIDALDFVRFLAYLIVALFVMREIERRWPDSAVGRALTYLHG